MADLDIKERQIGNITILDIKGNVRIGEANISLRTAIRQLVKERKHQILLNLSGATYIDSSGLGEFISGYVALNKVGGKLKLLHLSERVHQLMTITKLLTVFDVYDNETEAIESFTDKTSEIKEIRPPFVRESHNRPDDDDTGLKEGPISPNYSEQLWKSHAKLGSVQSPNRSHENTDGPLPPQD